MKPIVRALRVLLPVLSTAQKHYMIAYIVCSCLISLIDALSMALIAIVISLVVLSAPISLPLVGTLSVDMMPLVVVAACGLMLLKTALSVLLHWHATRKFQGHEFELGRRMFRSYIHSSWENRSRRSVAEVTRLADSGVANAIMGFILPLIRIPSIAVMFLVVLAVLVVANPLISVVALVYLAIISLIVNRLVTARTLEAAEENRLSSYRVANLMTEMTDALKELSLRNKLDQVATLVEASRARAVRARANLSILGIVPTSVFDMALIGGFLLVGAVSFLLGGPQAAVASVALFAATGFRLVPAIANIQAAFVQVGATVPLVYDLVNDIRAAEEDIETSRDPEDTAVLPSDARTLEVRGVRFRYPRGRDDVLHDIRLDIPLGTSLGIVGPSGAGKSTLVDLLLGLSQPTGGGIYLDGIPMRDVLQQWRSRVGYVPQRVALFNGSIAQNIALTWDDDIDEGRVWRALERAQLTTLIASRPEGIHSLIGERGVELSGGQQQRLGIARALYTEPYVLVMDEATSSLDTKTEDDVTQAIKSLRGQVTMIVVAHRLATIKDSDRIVYLEDGRVLGVDSFSRLARAIPQFGEQVALAGLGVASDL